MIKIKNIFSIKKNKIIIANQEREIEELKNKIEELEVELKKDSLPDTYNRRYALTQLDKIIKKKVLNYKNKKGNLNLGIILMDIDYFKKINDQYGHQIGDEVLLDFAKNANLVLKEKNLKLYRYGGEEFFTIVEDLDENEIKKFAEELREFISYKMRIPEGEYLSKKKKEMNVTISIGISHLGKVYEKEKYDKRDFNDIPCDFFMIADKNLYVAKEKGRNRIYI